MVVSVNTALGSVTGTHCSWDSQWYTLISARVACFGQYVLIVYVAHGTCSPDPLCMLTVFAQSTKQMLAHVLTVCPIAWVHAHPLLRSINVMLAIAFHSWCHQTLYWCKVTTFMHDILQFDSNMSVESAPGLL